MLIKQYISSVKFIDSVYGKQLQKESYLKGLCKLQFSVGLFNSLQNVLAKAGMLLASYFTCPDISHIEHNWVAYILNCWYLNM